MISINNFHLRLRRKLTYLAARAKLYLFFVDVCKITNKDLLIYLSKVDDYALAIELTFNPHTPVEALENIFQLTQTHYHSTITFRIVTHPNATELLRRLHKLKHKFVYYPWLVPLSELAQGHVGWWTWGLLY